MMDTQISWGCAHCPQQRFPNFVDLRNHWQLAHNINVTIRHVSTPVVER